MCDEAFNVDGTGDVGSILVKFTGPWQLLEGPYLVLTNLFGYVCGDKI